VLHQLTLASDEIHKRAEHLVDRLRSQTSCPDVFSVEAVSSASGGGALPGLPVPSWAIAISAKCADHFAKQLRTGDPAVFCRVQDGRALIDLRTVLSEDDELLLERIINCSMTEHKV
jgi:L-seryl-tRNA(Ser) seleniumtransferase